MRHRLLALFIVFALGIAACGESSDVGSDDTAAAPSSAADATTAAPPDTTAGPDTTAAPGTTAAPETTTTEAADTTAAPSGSSEGSGDLQAALEQTSSATSGRMEGSFEITGAEGMPSDVAFAMPFSGAFDNEAGVFQFKLDMSGLAEMAGDEIPPGFEDLFGEMEVRQFGDVAYMKFPFFSLFLGVETEWIRFPAEDTTGPAESFGGAAPGNPADMLGALEDADATITEIGREQVRGVDTTHYQVTFDMEKLLESATPEERAEIEAQGLPFDQLPMEIWLGDDGYVYRYVMDIDGTAVEAPEGESFDRMLMIFEMYDYGTDIDVQEPGPGEFTDSEELGDLFDF